MTDIWQQKLESLCAAKLSRPSATAEQRRSILGKKAADDHGKGQNDDDLGK